MTAESLAPQRIFLTTDAVGGVWSYTLTLAAELTALGCDCRVAVLGPSPGFDQRAAAHSAGCTLVETGLPLEWTAQTPGAIEQAVASLAELARAWHADIAHLHSPALAAFPWPCPSVAIAHSCVATWWNAVHGGTMPQDLQWRAELVRTGLAAAHCVIAPSRSFATALIATYGQVGLIGVVANGAALPRQPARSGAARSKDVLCAGRLWDRGKNLAILDEAAGFLATRVIAAGPCNGPNGAEYCPRHLISLGVLDSYSLALAYREAAVFASPSLYEPFGLAVLEAAGFSTPLVLSDIPTFRELWEGAAVFVPPCDAQAWARELASLLNDEPRRTRLGTLASRRAATYSSASMARSTREIHRKVCTRALQTA